MPARVFFDTNIVVYAFGTTDPRSIRAKELLAQGGVISVQVLNEFISVARGRLRFPWPDVNEALWALRAVCEPVVTLNVQMHEAAASISERDSLSIYDAMIIAAAQAARCTIVYSEDMQDGRSFPGGLTIRNPFS
jgi:predicted nucleic acid-binding protein